MPTNQSKKAKHHLNALPVWLRVLLAFLIVALILVVGFTLTLLQGAAFVDPEEDDAYQSLFLGALQLCGVILGVGALALYFGHWRKPKS